MSRACGAEPRVRVKYPRAIVLVFRNQCRSGSFPSTEPEASSSDAERRRGKMENLEKEDSIRSVEEDDIRPPPHYRPDGPAQVVTADTGREGPPGRRALAVLIGSLVIIGVAWVVVATWFGHA